YGLLRALWKVPELASLRVRIPPQRTIAQGRAIRITPSRNFLRQKSNTDEIRQLSLTAACKARHGVEATKVADRLGKATSASPEAPSDQRATGRGRGNPVALSSGRQSSAVRLRALFLPAPR